MILLDIVPLFPIIVFFYLIAHTPAIILLITGLKKLKTNREKGKLLLIFSGLYFLIGGGICGSLLT